MKKSLLLITGLSLAAMLFTLAGCTPPGRAPWEEGFGTPPREEAIPSLPGGQQVGIWVRGEGRVTAVPDVALLRLGIEAQADTVAEAQRQGSQAMDGVMAALKAKGVGEKDIKTQQFNIQPIRQWVEEPGTPKRGREIIVGYRVSNRVTAKIRKIGDAGSTIEAVVGAGGDLIRVDSISFTIDDPTPLYAQAREKAVLDAKATAEQLAELTGVTLGKPIYISVGTGYIPQVFEERVMAAAPVPAPSPPPISPGETEISITVHMVYAIK